MNFLAHLFLSGPQSELMAGNFLADSVRTGMMPNFSPGIQKGILLHRAIDSYTDHHAVVELSKERLRPRYHKYASVIVDVFYDHFLAIHFDQYSSVPLDQYAQSAYTFLAGYRAIFPDQALRFYDYMTKYDILTAYAEIDGITRVMKGMAHRARFESGMQTCTEELREHYEAFGNEFDVFFPELLLMTEGFRADLVSIR
jgi:acyl carrier protein phosphodiesterase